MTYIHNFQTELKCSNFPNLVFIATLNWGCTCGRLGKSPLCSIMTKCSFHITLVPKFLRIKMNKRKIYIQGRWVSLLNGERKRERELSHTNVPFIHPTQSLKIVCSMANWFDTKQVLKTLNYSSHLGWIGHKPIRCQLIMLDEWEVCSYVLVPSLLLDLEEKIWKSRW